MKPQIAATSFSFDSLVMIACIYMVPVFFVLWIIRMLFRNARGKRAMRTEVRQLADEVKRLQGSSKNQ